MRRGIGFEVVPGITAAAACSAYAGIPLTHRGLARGVRFVTGHFRNDEALELDWAGLADPETTLVVYMGLAHARRISERLIAAGLPAATPAAAVQEGTTPRQRRLISTLGELPEAAEAAGLGSPVILVIGRVVELADALNWFGSDPVSTLPEVSHRAIH